LNDELLGAVYSIAAIDIRGKPVGIKKRKGG